MKNWSKVIAIAVCAVSLVAASVLGTIAALMVRSDTVTNTFTVGKISIKLDESRVDTAGNVIDNQRVLANTYKLFPAKNYTKDPELHVEAGSESCYLFIQVTNGIAAIEDQTEGSTIEDQILKNGWTHLDDGIYWRLYTDTTGKVDYPIFEEFTVGDVTDEQLSKCENATVTITAYAVQSAEVADASAAWELVASKYN